MNSPHANGWLPPFARKQHLPYLRLQETCVTTTWLRFCEKLLEVTDDPKWADQIERTFYNAYLAAVKPDGSEFAGYTPLSGNRYHGKDGREYLVEILEERPA